MNLSLVDDSRMPGSVNLHAIISASLTIKIPWFSNASPRYQRTQHQIPDFEELTIFFYRLGINEPYGLVGLAQRLSWHCSEDVGWGSNNWMTDLGWSNWARSSTSKKVHSQVLGWRGRPQLSPHGSFHRGVWVFSQSGFPQNRWIKRGQDGNQIGERWQPYCPLKATMPSEAIFSTLCAVEAAYNQK